MYIDLERVSIIVVVAVLPVIRYQYFFFIVLLLLGGFFFGGGWEVNLPTQNSNEPTNYFNIQIEFPTCRSS